MHKHRLTSPSSLGDIPIYRPLRADWICGGWQRYPRRGSQLGGGFLQYRHAFEAPRQRGHLHSRDAGQNKKSRPKLFSRLESGRLISSALVDKSRCFEHGHRRPRARTAPLHRLILHTIYLIPHFVGSDRPTRSHRSAQLHNAFIPRAGWCPQNFQSNTEVQMLVAMLNDALSENDEACMTLKAQYDAFSYLWLTDM